MATEPLPDCPYSKRGHRLSVILPPDVDHAVLLFCDRCGMTQAHTLDLPVPMDDLTAEAIADLARRQ